ncbi:MAG: T9SS type A sorting domain-containing protein [Candidatus Coatesbacteria bacterium]|nr:T9SS type A sorting domain-containing protein [Candidatus Coatesbacteria bacterium]
MKRLTIALVIGLLCCSGGVQAEWPKMFISSAYNLCYVSPPHLGGDGVWRVVTDDYNGFNYVLHEKEGTGWVSVGSSWDWDWYDHCGDRPYYPVYDSYGNYNVVFIQDGEVFVGNPSWPDGYSLGEMDWYRYNFGTFCPLQGSYGRFAILDNSKLYTGWIYESYYDGVWLNLLTDSCSTYFNYQYHEPTNTEHLFIKRDGRFAHFYGEYLIPDWYEFEIDEYTIAGSYCFGYLGPDGTVYITYLQGDELHLITDDGADKVDEVIVINDDDGFQSPVRLYADEDGPVVLADMWCYWPNPGGDYWYGEKYTDSEIDLFPKYLFRDLDQICIVSAEGNYNVCFYRDWQIGISDTDLEARVEDDGVLVSWTTEDDPGGTRWTLERDGSEVVNLSGRTSYRYLDRDLEPGVHRYTLVATTADGETFRVGPVEIVYDEESLPRVVLHPPYPCPASNWTAFELELPADCAAARLEIYDLAGRLVETLNPEPTSGRQLLALDCTSYAPGVYSAILRADGETASRRVLINH